MKKSDLCCRVRATELVKRNNVISQGLKSALQAHVSNLVDFVHMSCDYLVKRIQECSGLPRRKQDPYEDGFNKRDQFGCMSGAF